MVSSTILTHHSYRLLDLNSYPSDKRYGHYSGEREMPLDDIRGTEGRLNDFDDRFHTLTDQTRQRWMSVREPMNKSASENVKDPQKITGRSPIRMVY